MWRWSVGKFGRLAWFDKHIGGGVWGNSTLPASSIGV